MEALVWEHYGLSISVGLFVASKYILRGSTAREPFAYWVGGNSLSSISIENEAILCRTKHITRKKNERRDKSARGLNIESWNCGGLNQPTKEIRFERSVSQHTEILETTGRLRGLRWLSINRWMAFWYDCNLLRMIDVLINNYFIKK